MNLDIFAAGAGFYTRPPGGGQPLNWRWEEGHWISRPDEVPVGARQVDLGELPAELQEELLAYAARAATMGVQYRNPMN